MKKADILNFHFLFLPKWVQELIKTQALIDREFTKTKKKLGEKKTKELLIQFQNEAYAQKGVNSDYIINRLRDARRRL